MKILDYIKGNRKGEAAHRLELEAMSDALLNDAIDGFDSVPSSDHAQRIRRMQAKIDSARPAASTRLRRRVVALSAAAAAVCFFTVGTYIIFDQKWRTAIFASHSEPTISLEFTAQGEAVIYMPADHGRRRTNDIVITRETITRLSPGVVSSDVSDSDYKMESSKIRIAEIEVTAPVHLKERAIASHDDVKTKVDTSESRVAPEVVVTGYGTARKQAISASTIGCSSESMHDDTLRARPVAGVKAYEQYIQKNIKLPADKTIKGEVVVRFEINKRGRPYNFVIIQSLSSECDKEAIRLIENGADWKSKNGLATTITILF